MTGAELVMAEGSAMVEIGLALGLGGALAVTRLAESFLYGVMPNDLIAFCRRSPAAVAR